MLFTSTRLTLCLCAILACRTTLATDSTGLPSGITNDQSETDVSLSPTQSLSRITVPDGFSVSLFAGEPNVFQPIAFTFDDRGRLWVVENFSHPNWKETGHDRILIFEDTNHDGVFDVRKVFYDKGRYLSGIQFGHGGVYVCNVPELIFIPDADGDDVPDGDPIVLLNGWATHSPHNVMNNLTWGPDGWLYGCVGQNNGSRIGSPDEPQDSRSPFSRGLWRYHPLRHTFEIVATGAVNPWGLDFDERGEGFFSNCVLPHLWHLIPGAYYQRRSGERDNPYAYERIQPITDHLHWGGGSWTSSRGGQGKHSVAGGGHAHTGSMIYQGNNWPAKYRGTYFVGNLHGNRINNDTLERQGSGYVAKHAKDFLMANDPWFRTLTQKTGPDGGVYVSDWHDLGECHDTDGSHRSSGRIYKVVYGKPEAITLNMATASNDDLVGLLAHENEWQVRHARRLLHERAAKGIDMNPAHRLLRQMMNDKAEIPLKLRAIWSLWLTDGLSEEDLRVLLAHTDEHIRSWSIRLLCENKQPSPAVLKAFTEIARTDESSLVRLHLSAALQRIPLQQRWEILTGLMSRVEDAQDPNLPLMTWYALAPLVKNDPERALAMLSKCEFPTIRRFTARLLCEPEMTETGLPALMTLMMNYPEAPMMKPVLTGMVDSLKGRRDVAAPIGWEAVKKELFRETSPEDLLKSGRALGSIFNDHKVRQDLRALVSNRKATIDARSGAIEALTTQGDTSLSLRLHALLNEPDLAVTALNALASRPTDDTPTVVIGLYANFRADARRAAIQLLAGRQDSALLLLKTIADGDIKPHEVPLLTVLQMKKFESKPIDAALDNIWGSIQARAKDKTRLMAEYRTKLTPQILAKADLKAGKAVFTTRCAVCHTLFNEGGKLGPDLTGSGRADVSYVLENLLNPSALVSTQYQLVTVVMKDGRIISGMLRGRTRQTMTFQVFDQELTLTRSEIKTVKRSPFSTMPEGLLQSMSDDEVRDLLGYLASQPSPTKPHDSKKTQRFK